MTELLILGTSEGAWALCRDGVIGQIGAGEPPHLPDAEILNAGDTHLLPGLIDTHVHGGADHDTMDATRDALVAVAQFHAKHGVTGFLATTWTDTRERTTAALENVKANLGRLPGGATLLGAHLEGPYINRDKGGAQNLDLIRRADPAEYLPWLDLDVIRIVSLAPEFEENHGLIAECVRRGIAVSIAHTGATYEQALHGIEIGITHSTHTYNAMTPLNHREPGVVGAVLTDDRVLCELIADNIHVHPAAMRILWQIKGGERVVLVSDAIRAAGMTDGDYPVDERTIHVRDGAARLSDGTLAGSILTLDRGLYNFAQATGQRIVDAGGFAAQAQANAAGVAERKGKIAVGMDADLILMDDHGTVHATIIAGEVVYQA